MRSACCIPLCLGLAACGSVHDAPDAWGDASRRDVGARDAGADLDADTFVADASLRDAHAGLPFSPCDETPEIELGRSTTSFASGDPALVADAHGWLAAWALYEGVFASRPGGPVVRLFDSGAYAEALANDEGALVCAWSAAGDAGRCVTLDADLALVGAPTDVDYATALGFARLGGALYALEEVLPTVSARGTVALLPISTDGHRIGPRVTLPCQSEQSFVPPASTDTVIACVVDTGPSCDLGAACPRALRLVSIEGLTVAPDVPIPFSTPAGPAPFFVRVGASGGAFLVAWIERDGLHALPVSAAGVAGAPVRVGAVAGPGDFAIGGIEAGYAIAYEAGASRTDPQLGLALLSPAGHPIAAPRSVAAGGMPTVVGRAGAGVALSWLDRRLGHRIAFRALGCGPALGACPTELAQCAELGAAVCVATDSERCHCGACGVVCDDACVAGACVPCPAGTVACGAESTCSAWGAPTDVVCASLDDDPAHCGACDHACATGQICVDGACCAGHELACGTHGDLDCDGRVDCGDCDCWVSSGSCGIADPGSEYDCTDGFSDDSDGLVDCADPDCASARPCGGAGRCPGVDLGTTSPLAWLTRYAPVDSDLDASCGATGVPEVTYRWTAPSAGRYTFSAGGAASLRPVVYLRDAACGGAELACGLREVAVDLAMGQSVVVVIEGTSTGCAELTISP